MLIYVLILKQRSVTIYFFPLDDRITKEFQNVTSIILIFQFRNCSMLFFLECMSFSTTWHISDMFWSEQKKSWLRNQG